MFPADEKDDVTRYLKQHLPRFQLLPTKEQLALRHYYLDSLTIRDTGTLLGLTREATRQLIGRALWRLRRNLQSIPPPSLHIPGEPNRTHKNRGL
jgi:DNA-directed RNA polymerase specialized sigma subunit